MTTVACSICKTPGADEAAEDYGNRRRISCARCGAFIIFKPFAQLIEHANPDVVARVSGWIRQQNEMGTEPILKDKNAYESLSRLRIPTISARADRLLSAMCKQADTIRKSANIKNVALISGTYSKHSDDVLMLAQLLIEQQYIERVSTVGDYNVKARGYLANEKVPDQAGTRVFVAMSFDKSMADLYDKGLSPGIVAAGYEPLRIDRLDHNNKIDDEILANIRTCRFLVADYTGHRGGVYFETGFAMGLDKPVIFTCRDTDIGSLHFDVRQFNTIVWAKVVDLPAMLTNRIVATIGLGPIGEVK